MALPTAPSILVGIVFWLAVVLVVVGLLYAFGEHRPRERSDSGQK